jgi:hypothetical protein
MNESKEKSPASESSSNEDNDKPQAPKYKICLGTIWTFCQSKTGMYQSGNCSVW